VTAPHDSLERKRLARVLDEISRDLQDLNGPYSLEAILRREPSNDEVLNLVELLRELAPGSEVKARQLPKDLGLVLANQSEPGQVILDDHGEPSTSRIGMSRTHIVGGSHSSTITLRIAYSDERAGRFIDDEARQLPREAPGLVMVNMGNVVTTRGAWKQLVQERFQPNIHTRVSAVCLFESGVVPNGPSLDARIAAAALHNEHARLALPDWLASNLGSWPETLMPEHAPGLGTSET